MTLKEELEILRGEPIEVFAGDPLDIPCIETSDPDKLCKNPVVSVHMITYNQEPYIRQAIEGVMMQKTDFEFELVIGEDCSQDKTREICFEYQKKYPDKIRVLWWHENVSKLGGNGRRTRAHCRGEFMAFCEGDDYWIDPHKLQKQVDIFHENPNIGLCFCGAVRYIQNNRCFEDWPLDFNPGIIEKDRFFSMMVDDAWWPRRTVATASVMFRSELYKTRSGRYDIFKWKLRLGDLTMWTFLGIESDVYFLPDVTSVYRINAGSVCGRNVSLINRDAYIVKEYFILRQFESAWRKIPRPFLLHQFHNIIFAKMEYDNTKRALHSKRLFKFSINRGLLLAPPMLCFTFFYYVGINFLLVNRIIFMVVRFALKFNNKTFKMSRRGGVWQG